MFQQEWGDTPSGKVLRELKNAVTTYREELFAEWEAKVDQ
jgi:hypothetical protein